MHTQNESSKSRMWLLRRWFRRVKEMVLCGRGMPHDGMTSPTASTFNFYTKEDLVIGRDWVFVRTHDGRMRFVCGKAEENFIHEVCSWRNVVCAAAGFHEAFAVLSSGVVVGASSREKGMGIMYWRHMKSVVACEGRVAGVTHDNAIVSRSDQSGYEKPEDYDRQLEQRFSGGDVKRLAVGWLHAAVLDVSGRVSVVGEGKYCGAGDVLEWRDVVDIDVFGCYYSPIQTVGLRSDGRVLHTLKCPEIDSWCDVVSISCLGSDAVAALTADGHVLLAGNRADHHREAVKGWPPMAAVRGNFDTLAGISRDGDVWVFDGRRQYCLRRNAAASVVLAK